LITNGTLRDRETVGAILESGLDGLQVTLWADSVEEYRRQHPGADPDNFRRVIDGLRLVASSRGRGRARCRRRLRRDFPVALTVLRASG